MGATGAGGRAEHTGTAYARAGLVGNPSDGYGGKAIAMVLPNFRAVATTRPADGFVMQAGDERLDFATLRAAAEGFVPDERDDGLHLVHAAVRRFVLHAPGLDGVSEDDPRARFAIGFDTDIPRQVGLSGSSAIVIAVMRALMSQLGVHVEPAELAELALDAEVEDLGLAGGAMDRVVQAYEGVVLMDLREPRSAASYRRLDPGVLPPLFIAWDPRGGESSGRVHGALRARWDSGDQELRRIMKEFRQLVDAAVDALERGDHDAFRALMRRNLELRASFFPISTADRQMIDIAQDRGAVAKLCGSGGAVVGSAGNEALTGELEAAYRDHGFEWARPSPQVG